jgi:hypothetical protein
VLNFAQRFQGATQAEHPRISVSITARCRMFMLCTAQMYRWHSLFFEMLCLL